MFGPIIWTFLSYRIKNSFGSIEFMVILKWILNIFTGSSGFLACTKLVSTFSILTLDSECCCLPHGATMIFFHHLMPRLGFKPMSVDCSEPGPFWRTLYRCDWATTLWQLFSLFCGLSLCFLVSTENQLSSATWSINEEEP